MYAQDLAKKHCWWFSSQEVSAGERGILTHVLKVAARCWKGLALGVRVTWLGPGQRSQPLRLQLFPYLFSCLCGGIVQQG